MRHLSAFILLPTLFALLATGCGGPSLSVPSAHASTLPVSSNLMTDRPLPKPLSYVGPNLPPILGVSIHGLFLTGWVAGDKKRLQSLITTVKAAGINAFVINVKDDDGNITYLMQNPLVRAMGAEQAQIPDIRALLRTLHQNGIYAIARIVTFKDPVVAPKNPTLAVQRTSGGLYKDASGATWLDPYNQKNWDYILAVAQGAARDGFDEIQFDYVRFPGDGNLLGLTYPANNGHPFASVITTFLTRAESTVKPFGIPVGADIFGLTTVASNDMGIGQEMLKVGGAVNVISPMVYPALYATGTFGESDPGGDPYNTVFQSLSTAKTRLETAKETVSMVPWLQDFSLKDHYGPQQVQQEILALQAAGYDQFFLWNPACNYPPDILAALSEGK